MRRTTRTRLAAVAGLGLAVLAAACGGGAEAAGPSTLPTLPPSFASTTSTRPRVTAPDGSTVPSVETTTTTTIPPAVWPLTGLPGADVPRAALPALVVKIDNHPRARPQVGLVQADVVFEEIVEGITRFFAVFHSTVADPVGPVRSARTTDIDLLRQLQRPLFAWSGANNGTIKALREADVATDVGYAFHSKEAGWFRDAARRAPHNLLSTTTALWGLTPQGAGPPPPLFKYRAAGAPAPGVPAAGVKLTMLGTKVLWQWDPVGGVWLRTQDDQPHVDASGTRIAPANVVVMSVEYRRSPADPISPEAVTVGEGDLLVFTGGNVIAGRWVRPDPSKPATLIDQAGAEILLTPGRTWVELSRPGGANVVPAGTDPATVPYPSAK
jgi:hypothetical protein